MIRRARPSDSACLVAMQRECLPGDLPLDPSVGMWWIVPGAAFCCLTFVDSGTSGYLARAGVLPHARGFGLQRRLIRVREAQARRMGITRMLTDCTSTNNASANSLIGAGYRLYTPQAPWALPNSLYWKKTL